MDGQLTTRKEDFNDNYHWSHKQIIQNYTLTSSYIYLHFWWSRIDEKAKEKHVHNNESSVMS